MNNQKGFLSAGFSREKYINNQDWYKLQNFISDKETPFLILFKDKARNNYQLLKELYKDSSIYYAVKACPNLEILKIFIEEGSCFDIASIYELDLVLGLGATPDKISYGNTIKKEKHIKYAYEKGIKMFATDSEDDLYKISRAAPGSRVYFRLLSPCIGAERPLSRKFGCEFDMAYSLAIKAKELGLISYGVSFHVGSQQNDLTAWDLAITKTGELFKKLEEVGIKLEMVNMGGGLPTQYIKEIKGLDEYMNEIKNSLKKNFGNNIPEIIMEPGRSLVGDIGVIVSEIVLISKKQNAENETKWVFLDIGKFSGLIETLDESIKYPFYVEKTGNTSPVILAGPTCDSMDILYENYKYELPETLISGDKVYIFSTGAYTQSYSAIEFNGFPPLKIYVL